MKLSSLVIPLLACTFVAAPCHSARAQTQREMTEESAKEFEKVDARLNVVYKKVVATLDDVGKKKLAAAQRAWVAFRDAQAAFDADSERGGSIASMEFIESQTTMTKERTKYLEKLAEAK